jgi:hypothetical protein
MTTPACTQYPPDWWFRDKRPGNPPAGDTLKAIAICRTECALTERCLAEALAMEAERGDWYRHGVWGGTTPEERTALARGAR